MRSTLKIRHYITDRYHPLPENYVPEDLVRAPVPFVAPIHDMKRCISMVAYEPLRKLFNACFKEGFDLMGVSAFRSYSRQKEIFDESVKNRGREYTAARIAYPGTSEHQTGLAIDVSCRAVDYDLCEEFASTKEGIWLRNHAHEFGFVFSFTKENECYTGYINEPWHIRYVCEDATYYPYDGLELPKDCNN